MGRHDETLSFFTLGIKRPFSPGVLLHQVTFTHIVRLLFYTPETWPGVVLVLIETGLAKMRLFRLTEFLGTAFLMATLGMLSYFILE
jgi:hypothetical protein